MDSNLFGDYRDSSLDIFSTNYDSFFTNEAFTLPNFSANPFNADALQESTPIEQTEKVLTPAEPAVTFPRGSLNCNKIWDKVSAMAEADDIDIDALCSDLRAKAKCSENGLVVTDTDFHAAVAQHKKN